MSIKDNDKVVNIYNGTTGDFVISIDYLDLMGDRNVKTETFLEFASYENLSFNRLLKKMLENKDDITIKIGYKSN